MRPAHHERRAVLDEIVVARGDDAKQLACSRWGQCERGWGGAHVRGGAASARVVVIAHGRGVPLAMPPLRSSGSSSPPSWRDAGAPCWRAVVVARGSGAQWWRAVVARAEGPLPTVELAILCDGASGEAVLELDLIQLRELRVGRHRERVQDEAVLETLHSSHLVALLCTR